MAMAFKRRKTTFRKKTYRKTNRKSKMSKSLIPSNYLVKRLAYPIDLKYNGGGFSFTGNANASSYVSGTGFTNTYDVGIGLPFKLGAVIDPADLTSMFDRYRIIGVKLKFMFDINDANITGAGVLPWITLAQDYDDALQPANEQTVLTKQYAKSKRLDKPFSIFLRPKPQLMIGQQAGTVGNSGVPNSTDLYFNCTDTEVVFYGLKAFIRGWYSPAGAQSMLRIQPTYYLSLKDTQ